MPAITPPTTNGVRYPPNTPSISRKLCFFGGGHHNLCDTTTGPLFENFVQKSEKIVDEYTRKINFTLKNGDCAITAKFRPPKNLTVFTERFVFAWFSEVCCRKTKGTHSPSSIFETLNSLLTRAPHPCMVQLDSHEISLRSFLAARLFGNYVAKLRIK